MRKHYFAQFVILVILFGCASEKAFNNAKSSAINGEPKGFEELKRLTETYPERADYKSFYFRQREIAISKLLQRAKDEQKNAFLDKAENTYQEILKLDPLSDRAKQGLQAVFVSKANEAKIKEATILIEQSQDGAAKEKLHQVLISEPSNNKASSLLGKLIQKKLDENNHFTKISSKFKKQINLELKEVNIKDVFELLSKSAGVNFILDKELKAGTKVSIYVKNASIDDALNNIFSANQLSRKILNENTVLVYPNSKKGEYEEIISKTFYLKNVEPKKAEELIKTVLKTKDIFIDDKLNVLVMRGSRETIQMAEKLINTYDIGDPEVLLEVEVLEISDTLASEIGLRWPNQASASISGAAGAGQLTLNEAKNINSDMVSLTITDPTLLFNLKSSDGASNLLANPHIRVKNRKKAKIHIGDRVPVITNTSTATGFVSESVSYLDVGLKLDVEPTIMMDDEVSIDVALEVSNIVNEIVTSKGSVSYRLGTRNAATVLRLKNGETQMLAGLINNEERSSADKVPGLSSLPIIGKIFSSKKTSGSKTEIVLLIRPKIIRNLMVPYGLGHTEVSLGTEGGGRSSSGSNTSSNYDTPIYQTQQEIQPAPLEASLPPPITPIQLNIPAPPPLP